MHIRIGHSPDPDDAYMFYGLVSGRVGFGEHTFSQVVEDIESLNRRAVASELEVTAVSAHAYAHISDRYYVMSAGASMGEGYGPKLLTKDRMSLEDLRGKTIAIPGLNTTAYLGLRMILKDFKPHVTVFDKVIDEVLADRAAAALVIHDAQVTYPNLNLHEVLDLGAWWSEVSHGLPLPLGLDVSRKDLGKEFARQASEAFRASIRFAGTHKEDALRYASKFARTEDLHLIEKFVDMYVNHLTIDMGTRGASALKLLYDLAHSHNLTPKVDLEII